MWSSRFFWKIFLVTAGLNLSLAVAFHFFLVAREREIIEEQVVHRLHDSAMLLRERVAGMDLQQRPHGAQQLIRRLAGQTGTRMTVIRADGVVVADSQDDPARMENHRDRPELLEARANRRRGLAQRYSETLGIRMVYLALPILEDNQVVAFVRLSMEVSSVESYVQSAERYFWGLAFVVELLTLSLTFVVIRRIVRPLEDVIQSAAEIAAGDDSITIPTADRGEIGRLGEAVSQMQATRIARHKELQAYSDRMQSILANMAEGVLAVAPDETILLANNAARKLLQVATQDPSGKKLVELTRSRTVADAVRKTIQTGEPTECEFESPGTTRNHLALRTTRLPGSPCPGVMLVVRDVTNLRRLEGLRQEFVANVSHELKTPLASVKAYAETLKLGAIHDPENNLRFVQRIEEQADRLDQLIQDLLQLARVESGQEAFEITQIDLTQAVKQRVAEHRDNADTKSITLRTELPSHPIIAQADEEGIRAILNNLIDNAIKYSPENGIVIVRTRSEAGKAILEVEDNGIGISAENIHRVFERFYRVDKARSRELGGTGLGLSIVKHLAQAFHGTVDLESEVGKGSIFRVQLPLVSARAMDLKAD